MTTSHAIDTALDAAAECEQALRSAGLVHAAAHARAAAGSLREARRSAARRLAAEGGRVGDAERGLVPLTLEDGRPTGFAMEPVDATLGRRVALGTPADARLAAIAPHDLGWDLVRSREATRHAVGDVDAALLQAALSSTGWVAPERAARWATSRSGAATVVRLMRRGRAAPTLADAGGPLLDLGAVELIRSLGWRPERRD